MFVKIIAFLFFASFVTREALSQRQNTAEHLQCYHCDPADLKTNGAGIRMECLQNKDMLGELRHCPLADQLCVKGEMEFEGNTVDIRRCQLAKGKTNGECDEIHIMEIKTKVCFCDTDGCNGTGNILPQSFTVLLAISGVLMMLCMK